MDKIVRIITIKTIYLKLLLFAVFVHFNSHEAVSYPQQNYDEKTLDWFLDHLFSITDVMVTDVATPPGAARFYSYSLLAAHLAQQENWQNDPILKQLQQAIDFQSPTFNGKKEKNRDFCSIYSMLEVGKMIMPSGKKLVEAQNKLVYQFIQGKSIKKKDLQANIAFSKDIAGQVLAYAKTDGYGKLSTLKRYSPSNREGGWYPTPPAYMAAIDPEWKTIRPFFIENLKDFAPPPPAPFSLEKESSFYTQLKEVYHTTQDLTEDQQLIANFWDCNPFNVSYSGHMAIGLKKISPGGHWIGITGIAAKKAQLDLKSSIFIHTLVAMTLHDAFISCWAEKYQSDRIRPITAINKHIDPAWRPILQTPPFPEYTSGHSVISKASAVVLTAYFGDDFDFIDTSEVFFGLPERPFSSFLKAADEAAISRLYGGIHFRDAIEVGENQGEKIAQYILDKTNSPALFLGDSN